MVSPFHTYKLSVVYRDVGEVGGGYNSGGFPISYYITPQSLMYVFDFVCFIPSKYLTLRSITCACGICGDYARHSVFQGVVSDLDLLYFNLFIV